MNKLYKSRDDKWIDGVVGGLAIYLGTDSSLLRIIVIILTLSTGVITGCAIYILVSLIMPNQPPYGHS